MVNIAVVSYKKQFWKFISILIKLNKKLLSFEQQSDISEVFVLCKIKTVFTKIIISLTHLDEYFFSQLIEFKEV